MCTHGVESEAKLHSTPIAWRGQLPTQVTQNSVCSHVYLVQKIISFDLTLL